MRILYAIQGTGNGHLSRAIEVIPALQNRAQVTILVSGIQGDIELPFLVKYKLRGLSFIFGKNGGIDYFQTFKKNSVINLLSEIKKCPVTDYDLVINDFEPITAWACKLRGVNCISLSHQSALLSKKVPMPEYKDRISQWILKNYAPTLQQFGFHFKEYDKGIFLPIIKKRIRYAIPKKKKHYTVYLPSYSDERLIKLLSKVKNVKWHVFSKHTTKSYSTKNLLIEPVNLESFEKSIINCSGVLCGAGFETPAEALFLGKKLMVIPMKGQYEQHINAASLKELGVPVLKKLKKENIYKIQNWVDKKKKKRLHFPDATQKIIDVVLSKYIIATELSKELI